MDVQNNAFEISDNGKILLDKFRGCLLGLATGDALGTTVEFKAPGSFQPVTDIKGGGPFSLNPGEWTDDTSMALCIAESFIEKKAYDVFSQMEKFRNWFFKGHLSSNGRCFDIGNTTKMALLKFHPNNPTSNPYCGSTENVIGGNGCIMRLCAVPLFFYSDVIKAIETSGDSSRTTHGAPACVDGCRYMASLILGGLYGYTKEQILSDHFFPGTSNDYWKKHPLHRAIAPIAKGSFKIKNPPEIMGRGNVASTLEAALWAFYHTDNFKDGCLKVVNLGDDADTTGAVYGQIAGAFYGENNIPEGWRKILAKKELLESYANKLFDLATVNITTSVTQTKEDTIVDVTQTRIAEVTQQLAESSIGNSKLEVDT